MTTTPAPLLEAVPNVSAGHNVLLIDGLTDVVRDGIARGSRVDGSTAELVDVHRDGDHDRAVLTIVGRGEALARGLVELARSCVERIDLHAPSAEGGRGVHPRTGALDVLPIVPLDDDPATVAAAHSLVRRLAHVIGGDLDVPVVRYARTEEGGFVEGAAATGQVRRGGLEAVAERIASGDLALLGGPSAPHPTAGVAICGVRDVLVAFNVDLATDDHALARAIAARIREAAVDGGGLPGVRALGLHLRSRGTAQVSTNVERYRECGPARVLERVVELAADAGVDVAAAELVGLAPDAALAPLRYACTRLGVPLLAAANASLDDAVAALR